jgi:hypothetical protein
MAIATFSPRSQIMIHQNAICRSMLCVVSNDQRRPRARHGARSTEYRKEKAFVAVA